MQLPIWLTVNYFKMAKVFSLIPNNQGVQKEHWAEINSPYGPTEIETIPNSDGDKASKAPTSIPSPFARIDLFRTAFKFVNNSSIDGDSIYHKLVSDCWDTGVLFFKKDHWPGLEISKFDKEKDLTLLSSSSNDKHKLFASTLNLFLEQDSATNNFNEIDSIYFIKHNNKVIGGTSPTTLFFASANDLTDAQFTDGNDVLFDKIYFPLYKRDPEFQKFIYAYFYRHALQHKMIELADYLMNSLEILGRENVQLANLLHSFRNMNTSELESILNGDYNELNTGIENNLVEIFTGQPLRKQKQIRLPDTIEKESGFKIKSQKYTAAKLPLVLQNGFSQSIPYTNSSVKWDNGTTVPYYNPEPLDKRKLPTQSHIYPYITVSDFLEPTLIRLKYPANENKFSLGNIVWQNVDTEFGMLLPLSNLFFDFFDAADLFTEDPSKPSIKFEVYGTYIEVHLRVPIQNNNAVVLSRKYNFPAAYDTSAEPDLLENHGTVQTIGFGLAIYPDLKFENAEQGQYRVMMIDRSEAHLDLSLKFFKSSNDSLPEDLVKSTSRSDKSEDAQTTKFYALKHGFDYIQLSLSNGKKGILVPKLSKQSGGNTNFQFAVDFGTTNTHIEYKQGNSIKPFEISASDRHMALLHDHSSGLTEVDFIHGIIPHEFLPVEFGETSLFSFPQRTNVSANSSLNFNTNAISLADINISFVYGKELTRRNTEVHTNLKWSNFNFDDGDKTRVKSFLEQVIFLMRNKVLLNNGNLEQFKLIWFYPTSMSSHSRGTLADMWKELFIKYFGSQNIESRLTSMSEAIAPFYYYKENQNIQASHHNVVNIDIGGGTTDIVVFKQNSPALTSSFRFAANSILGGKNISNNGFAEKYYPKFEQILTEMSENFEGIFELEDVISQIKENNLPEDLISFFFSLDSHPNIGDNDDLDFADRLKHDSELKIVFVVFYASIIYYLGRLLNINDIQAPNTITLSGTGSKIINILNTSANSKGVVALSKLAFNAGFGSEAINELKVISDPHPKEITCKGGLSAGQVNLDFDTSKSLLIGNKCVAPGELSLKEIDGNILNLIASDIENFYDSLLDSKALDFMDLFMIPNTNIAEYKAMLKGDIQSHLKGAHLDLKPLNGGNENTELNDTLFFVPIMTSLQELAFQNVQSETP
jgi:hypothetical protein